MVFAVVLIYSLTAIFTVLCSVDLNSVNDLCSNVDLNSANDLCRDARRCYLALFGASLFTATLCFGSRMATLALTLDDGNTRSASQCDLCSGCYDSLYYYRDISLGTGVCECVVVCRC